MSPALAGGGYRLDKSGGEHIFTGCSLMDFVQQNPLFPP